jgi:DNA-3-methyladenine glycosylase II
VATVRPVGPFSLAAALGFLEGFPPADGAGPHGAAYRAAHVLDDGVAHVVAVEDAGDGTLHVAPDAAEELVRRVFALDWDGDAFARLGDPVIAALRDARPGLRPVLFATPWEAACWSLIGHRVAMRQAARIKAAVRARFGPEVEGLRAFPAPHQLVDAPLEQAGVPELKADRIRALAERAAVGDLDADVLLGMPTAEAQAWLQASPGIGPWSSGFVLIRGAGAPDLLPVGEKRLHAAVGAAYGLGRPATEAELAELGARWAPFRAWAGFLLRVAAEPGSGAAMGRVMHDDGGAPAPPPGAPAG